MKTTRLVLISSLSVALLVSCSGNASKGNDDSAKHADSLKTVHRKDSIKKDSLRKDSLVKDSVAKASAAPTSASDPAQLEKDIKAGKVKVLFEGMGTEPFWTVYITRYEYLKIDEGVGTKNAYLLVNQFDPKLKKQTISYKDDTGKAAGSVVITREEASPGMGPGIFPYAIRLGPTLDGAGDTLYIKDFSKYDREN